jgi:tetratricopeptide (TPR) repeat protein
MALREMNELLAFYQEPPEYDKILDVLQQMAALAPENRGVRLRLADLYLKLGMSQEGLAQLNLLAELQLKAGLQRDSMATYQRSASLYYTLGEQQRGINICERIVHIAPRDLGARDQLINMYVQSGKIKEAIANSKILADMFIQEGRIADAVAALHQLVALSPFDVEVHYLLANQLLAIGRYHEAERLYARLEKLEPHNDYVPLLHREMQRLVSISATATASAAGAATAVSPSTTTGQP